MNVVCSDKVEYPLFIYSWFNNQVSRQPRFLLPQSVCPCWTFHSETTRNEETIPPPQRIPAGSLNVFSLRFILTCRRSIENTIFLFKFCIMYIRVSIILRAWNASQTACSNNISPNWTDIFITKKFRKKQYFGNILYPHPSPILFGSQKGLPSLRRSLPLIFLFNFLAPTHNCAKRLQA